MPNLTSIPWIPPGSDAAKTVHDLLAEFIRTDVGKKYASKVIFNYVPVEKKDTSDKAASLPALRVKAMMFKFYSVERSYEGGFKAMEAFRVWEKALAFVNDGAPASAGAGVLPSWVCSPLPPAWRLPFTFISCEGAPARNSTTMP